MSTIRESEKKIYRGLVDSLFLINLFGKINFCYFNSCV